MPRPSTPLMTTSPPADDFPLREARPIAQAPRDGRVIRVFCRGEAFRALWDADQGFWREAGGSRFWDDRDLEGGWAPLLCPVQAGGARALPDPTIPRPPSGRSKLPE